MKNYRISRISDSGKSVVFGIIAAGTHYEAFDMLRELSYTFQAAGCKTAVTGGDKPKLDVFQRTVGMVKHDPVVSLQLEEVQ